MRLLADENVHAKVVSELRTRGHEVEWIKENSPGISDPQILERPDISAFTFITNDRDFGNLIFAKAMPVPASILYTRTPHRDWKRTADRLIDVLSNGQAMGQFVTIESESIRYKPLPTGTEQ